MPNLTFRSGDALAKLQSEAKYLFRNQEFAQLTGRKDNPVATKSALMRLSKTGRIVSLSKHPAAWIIVPPEHTHFGAPPVDWWLHDFMNLVEPHYYLGLLSAAKHWGSSHYALQETQVMVTAPRRPINVGKIKLVFHTKNKLETTPTVLAKTGVAPLRISTREATLLDLIRHQDKNGGLEAVARITLDFKKAIEVTRLIEALNGLDNTSAAQRLGFVFDVLQLPIFANVVEAWLHNRPRRKTPLTGFNAFNASPNIAFDGKWGVSFGARDLAQLKEQI